MKNLSRFALALLAASVAFSAYADPIEVVQLPGGEHPDTLGGYMMTPFVAPDDGWHRYTASPSGGRVRFDDGDGNRIWLRARDPEWWNYDGTPTPDQGNIFVVRGRSLVDLILPRNTRAISFFVGANMPAHGWIEAFDNQHNATGHVNFGIGPRRTQGFGIYTTGCSSLTRVSVDPVFLWGFGYMSTNQGACQSVPEPGTLALLGLGLLGLVVTRRLRPELQRTA